MGFSTKTKKQDFEWQHLFSNEDQMARLKNVSFTGVCCISLNNALKITKKNRIAAIESAQYNLSGPIYIHSIPVVGCDHDFFGVSICWQAMLFWRLHAWS